jgi:FkbM family methyltransferase
MTNPILGLAALAARWLPVPVKRALYRIKPLARLIRGGLNLASPAGLSEITISAGGLAGMRMLLDMQSEKDYWLGTYEPDLQQAVADLVKPGMVAYDVGANVGYITLLLARAIGDKGQVVAFEALPSNLARLRDNIHLNHLDGRVQVVDAAVVNTGGAVRFLVGPSDDMGKAEGSAGRQGIAYGSDLTVMGISLDEFVYDQGGPAPEVIKMDIEGGEVLAMPGMIRLLSEARPVVLLELHGSQAALEVWNLFARAGYRVCHMQPGYPGVMTVDALDWKEYLVAFPIA